MRTRLAEIDERLPQCRSELLTLADGDLGEDEATRFDTLEVEHKTLTDEREQIAARLARIDNVRETARTATAVAEQGNDDERSRSAGGRGVESGGGSSRAVRLDPFENLDAVRSNALSQGDLRARALNAIERDGTDGFTDEQRERATRLIERGDRHGNIARHILLTGSEAYTRAFGRILEGAQPWQLEADEVEALRVAESYRAMNEGTGAAGAFLVPFMLDPTVILQNAGAVNPFRQVARTETITTNTWHGVSSAGVTATWVAESTQHPTDDSPTFAQPTVATHRAAAYLQASFEVTQDTNVINSIGMMLADAKDRLEATAFAVGTGTGTQPQGVVTGVAAVPGSVVSTGAVGTYAAADVYNVKGALPPRYRPNASWVGNENTLLMTRQFASGTGPQHAFWADFGMATPSQLLGRPVYESSAMDQDTDTVPTGITTGKNLLIVGDFKAGFLIVDRIGMQVNFNPLVVGAAGRPTGEIGWYAHWRVGSGVLNADALRVLKVQ
jgi:HK97 family phage major capsid protein